MSTPFPSLILRVDGVEPQGDFARTQAEFLEPDPAVVRDLRKLLEDRQAGVVAHFYMDAELQGVLAACDWPWIFTSDSLAMADAAVKMASEGAQVIAVLGVDFMSENVRAVMDHAGFAHVPVLRLSEKAIGCSLAESAEAPAYGAWLTRAAESDNPLHVIYINTGLDVKARAQVRVPTITCTSSNVVRTVLQAFAQVPDLHLFYGPDTYMGENLVTLFTGLLDQPEDTIRALHPDHDHATLRSVLERFSYFRQGVCVVHHLFGDEVAARVARDYADCFHTAHLEVPGEMFALASAAQRQDRGVVGSTSDILGFILRRVREAVAEGTGGRLRFVLGTEAGMVTPIVKQIRGLLAEAGRDDLEVEIIFPVASEAVAQAPESGLGVVPGVASGEGCSVAGGCATCPYMKMNSLEALFDLLEGLGGDLDPRPLWPKTYSERIGERSLAEVGTEPILAMRHFKRTGELPESLVEQVTAAR